MKKKTSWIMVLTALLWLVWDIILFATGEATISDIMTNLSFYTPALPFAAGFLCGHWFWPTFIYRDKK